jgi:hypothetical protein
LGLGEALERRIDGSSGMMRDIRDGLRRDEISYLFIMRFGARDPLFPGKSGARASWCAAQHLLC